MLGHSFFHKQHDIYKDKKGYKTGSYYFLSENEAQRDHLLTVTKIVFGSERKRDRVSQVPFFSDASFINTKFTKRK